MDRKDLLTIGQFSRLTAITRDTLRHYDRIGLLSPSIKDEQSGYRYYSISQLWAGDMIYILRKLDISLPDIKSILSASDNEEVVCALAKSRNRALSMSEYYAQIAEDIEWYEKQNELVRKASAVSDIEIIRYEPKTVFFGSNTSDGNDYHRNLEYAVNEQNEFFGILRRHYGYILSEEDVLKGSFVKKGEFLSFERSEPGTSDSGKVIVLPGGEYACFNAEESLGKMDFTPVLNWLEENDRKADLYIADEIGLQMLPVSRQSRVFHIRVHLI